MTPGSRNRIAFGGRAAAVHGLRRQDHQLPGRREPERRVANGACSDRLRAVPAALLARLAGASRGGTHSEGDDLQVEDGARARPCRPSAREQDPGEIVLTDAAYGSSVQFRNGLVAYGLDYAVGINAPTKVWTIDARGRRSDEAVSVLDLGVRIGRRALQHLVWRDGTRGPMFSKFAFRCVVVAHDDGTPAKDRTGGIQARRRPSCRPRHAPLRARREDAEIRASHRQRAGGRR